MKVNDAGPSRDVPAVLSVRSTDDTHVDPDETGNFVVIPPDGGWGWVVVVAAFICNMLCDGVTYCFGLFMEKIAVDLKCEMTDVAITTSVLTAVYYLLGPLFCALTNRFGFRIICMTGSLVTLCVMIGASYATNLYIFIIIMGAIGGASTSMVYVTSIIIVGFYFERWRALATAIAVTGTAVGIIIMPQIIGLMDAYTWRQQFKFLSIGFGCTFLCGLMYRPLKPVKIIRSDDREGIIDSLAAKTTRSRGVDQASLLSEGTNRFFVGTGPGNRLHNKMFPTAAEVHGTASVSISQISGHSRFRAKLPFHDKPSISGSPVKKRSFCKRCCSTLCFKWKGSRDPSESVSTPTTQSKSKTFVPTRPMYRDDIFFQGSLTNLQQYHGQPTSKSALPTVTSVKQGRSPSYDYHMSVTRMATTTDIEEEMTKKWLCCPQSVKRILATMFDIKLLKQPSFTVFMLSGFFTVAGLYVPYIYVVDMNVKNGVEESQARFLLSVIGFTNAIGRIGCGLLSLTSKIKAILCMEICLIICGVSVLLLPFFEDLPMQYVFVSVFGLTNAANAALRSIIIVDLYGLENLTNAFGIAVLFQGVACCIGLPVSGVIKQKTGSYEYVMVFAGSSITFSGLLIIPIQFMNKRERQHAEQKMNRPTPNGKTARKAQTV